MLQGLNAQSKKVGLKINAGKTNAMKSSGMLKTNLQMDGVDVKKADIYVYLGQEVEAHHNKAED